MCIIKAVEFNVWEVFADLSRVATYTTFKILDYNYSPTREGDAQDWNYKILS